MTLQLRNCPNLSVSSFIILFSKDYFWPIINDKLFGRFTLWAYEAHFEFAGKYFGDEWLLSHKILSELVKF